MPSINLDEALAFACRLAKDAGLIARKHYSPTIKFDPKAHNSPVTLADTEINALVITRCKAAYPDIGILAEEESTPRTKEWLWVCDPIDGTIPYMLGMGASSFCLALVHNGQPVMGVVYDFMNDRLFSAVKGKNAFLNGQPLADGSATNPLKLIELETYPGAVHTVGDLRERLIREDWQAPNFATASFVAMQVAQGRIAGSVYTGNQAWDIAAAKVIVEACGGQVTDLDGNEQRYDGFIKGAIVVHPKYAEEIVRLTAEGRQHANHRH